MMCYDFINAYYKTHYTQAVLTTRAAFRFVRCGSSSQTSDANIR